ncbi:MAG TPA: serine/threonine-protein kinase [Candidatus Dormibacteraeota bacterium]
MALQTIPLSAIVGIGGGAASAAVAAGGRRSPSHLGPYRLLERIGAGAYAAVYRARHELMDVDRAVKVLRARAVGGPGERDQFLHEARVAARLRHPNVVAVHDCGIAGDGTPYIVMDLVAGRSLAERLRRGGPSVAETLRVARLVAAALDHAHALGVVHRDVKPANVLLGDDGAVQLADFGIAQAGRDRGGPGAPWAAIGTPAYMAPEQRLGERATARTDVYALAVVLAEMLTGRVPRGPADPDGEGAFSAVDPALPRAVDAVLARGLAREPRRRPPSAGDLVRALAAALDAPHARGALRRLRTWFARAGG